MSVPAGKLRHRLRIEQKVETPSGTGGVTISWSFLKTIWGEMVALSGREYLIAEQTQAQILVRARVRAGSGIDPLMRVIFRDLIYSVEAVLPDPVSWNEFETLMLSEGKNDG